ncbi:MAG: EAL domain-containing protein [Acaryochloridaceae cyanobacterium RL_2_7]|nr:EAL domain-containing protein [Acaryochloridaceae cyanobacterium RL_2_7]
MGERLGEAGHEYVAQHFTPKQISEQYQRVLQQSVLQNSDLKQAIESEEFCLYYQAIFSLSTGKIQGFEALLRWQKTPEMVLLPNDFIPRLETTGWILDLTGWILGQAAEQMQRWKIGATLVPRYLRINLSVKQFFDPLLIHHIEQSWLGQGLAGQELGFDITEAVLMKDPAGAIAILLQLQERGIQVYLDSFGAGVASLQSLHQFPLDGLALDRSLIAALGTKRGDRNLIASLISLGETLQVPLHAEGISTLEQLQMLKSLGFQLGQGQWLASPMAPAQATQLLDENATYLLGDSLNRTLLEAENYSHLPTAPLALIVDDDDIMRKILKRFLEAEGYQVIEAADGEKAVEEFQSKRPELVLLDAVMPGMNGFDCCQLLNHIRHRSEWERSHATVYLVTARDDAESIEQAFASGADDYLTKPVNWSILRQRLVGSAPFLRLLWWLNLLHREMPSSQH